MPPTTAADAARRPEALCLGETMLMVTPAGAEPLEDADLCLLRPGGAESNVAMYLAGLGHDVGWVSRVGDDAPGRRLLRSVGETGVGTSLVEVSGREPTGVYFKDPGPGGTRVHYYRSGSAASRMDRALVPRLAAAQPSLLHLSGITPALSESCADLVQHLLLDRPLGPTRLSFDVNHRPSLWTRDAAPELLRLARAADVVFVGLDEAEVLWGCTSPHAVREVLGPAVDRPGPVLVVKDGDVGATTFSDDGVTAVPAVPVDVVEPVGAGDAFAAGWLSAALRGQDQERRLRTGHLLAGVALTSPADYATPPDRVEVDRRLDGARPRPTTPASPTVAAAPAPEGSR